MTNQVFISHSTRDRLAVETVRLQLEVAGVKPYMYEYDLRPGALLVAKLRDAITSSSAMVVILTAESASSQSVHQEIGIALGLKKPVIPLVEAGVGQKELALLNGVEFVVFDPAKPEEALTAMVNQVRRVLEAQARDRAQAAMTLPPFRPVGTLEPIVLRTPSAETNGELAVVLALVGALLIVALLASRS